MAERWTNWAGNESCECEIARPRTLEALCGVVARGAREGRRVRATGGSYSWSPLVANPDLIVDTDALDRVLRFEAEPPTERREGRARVEVECGMSIRDLDAYVRKKEYTLVSPTLFPEPSVGGVVATGSHGTGFRVGNFSDQVVAMKIVRPDGSVAELARGHPDLDAARVALGTLGILYSVTLELAPRYNVYVDRRYVPAHYVLEEMEDLQRSCEYLEMFWFPFQDKMWLYIMNRTHSWPDRPRLFTRWKDRAATAITNASAHVVVPLVARHLPGLTPVVNGVASRFANEVSAAVKTASDAFHFLDTYPKNWDLSYAVPSEEAAGAWVSAVALVNEYARAERYPVNLALHARFTRGSDAWLAPNHGRPTCYIEVTTSAATPEALWRPFFDEIEARWAARPGARPHWGKLYGRLPELAGRYPEMDRFLAVRERWDPERTFLNAFLEEDVFQLGPRTTAAGASPRRPGGRAPRAGAGSRSLP